MSFLVLVFLVLKLWQLLNFDTSPMKKALLILVVLITMSFDTQTDEPPKGGAFDVGEWFQFRVHYGLVTAGYAEVEMKEAVRNNKKVFHAKGYGYTTGMTKFFFEVEDDYQSFFDKETGNPYQYIRKINEGGYKKNQEGFFDRSLFTKLFPETLAFSSGLRKST